MKMLLVNFQREKIFRQQHTDREGGTRRPGPQRRFFADGEGGRTET